MSSTYDFRIVSSALKRFFDAPKVERDLLEGVEFEAIDNCDDHLVDFDLAAVESNLKDLLSTKIAPPKRNLEDDEQENDSFYEIDDDDDDDDNDVRLETNSGGKQQEGPVRAGIDSYMNSMDAELKTQQGLSRLETDEELNLDLNLVSNALESYSSQMGLSGPVSNILKSLGL